MQEDFQRLVTLFQELSSNTEQGPFGYVWAGKTTLVNDFRQSHPKLEGKESYNERVDEIAEGIAPLIEGSLLIYLFALWESHVPDNINMYLTDDELTKLRAFKHVRDSVAHKTKGGRADFRNGRKSFEELQPFCGVIWNEEKDTLDISNAQVARDCREFFYELSMQLLNRSVP